MLKSIIKLKPNDILDVVNEYLFLEIGTDNDSYIKSKNHYEQFYSLSKFYNPSSCFEIGVRLGYSLGVIISASDKIKKVVGQDSELSVRNSISIAEKNIYDHILKENKDVSLSLHKINTQRIRDPKINDYFDLVHIDGGNNEVLHNLDMVIGRCLVCLVSGYNSKKDEIDKFLTRYNHLIKNIYSIPSLYGILVIEFQKYMLDKNKNSESFIFDLIMEMTEAGKIKLDVKKYEKNINFSLLVDNNVVKSIPITIDEFLDSNNLE